MTEKFKVHWNNESCLPETERILRERKTSLQTNTQMLCPI